MPIDTATPTAAPASLIENSLDRAVRTVAQNNSSPADGSATDNKTGTVPEATVGSPDVKPAADATADKQSRQARLMREAKNRKQKELHRIALQKAQRLDELEGLRDTDPDRFFREAGIDIHEQSLKFLKRNGVDVPDDKADELTHFKQQLDQEKQERLKLQQQLQERQLQEFKRELNGKISATIKADGDAFEAVAAYQAQGRVYAALMDFVREEGSGFTDDMLDDAILLACQVVEDEIVDEDRKRPRLKKLAVDERPATGQSVTDGSSARTTDGGSRNRGTTDADPAATKPVAGTTSVGHVPIDPELLRQRPWLQRRQVNHVRQAPAQQSVQPQRVKLNGPAK